MRQMSSNEVRPKLITETGAGVLKTRTVETHSELYWPLYLRLSPDTVLRMTNIGTSSSVFSRMAGIGNCPGSIRIFTISRLHSCKNFLKKPTQTVELGFYRTCLVLSPMLQMPFPTVDGKA